MTLLRQRLICVTIAILVGIFPFAPVNCLAIMNDKSNMEISVADEKSEILAPWADRWNERRIGFHQSDVHPILIKYMDKLLPSEAEDADAKVCTNTRIFIPLCGKTVDIAFLTTKASEVVGVEGIRMALQEFAEEHPDLKIESKGVNGGPFERFEGNKILLLKGDFFALDDTYSGGRFGAMFDRGSMVAIDPSLRKTYVETIGKLIATGGRILLAALERRGPEELVKLGPPFSIPEDTVKELFGSQDWVESVTFLEGTDELVSKPGYRERYAGLSNLFENIYLIQAK